MSARVGIVVTGTEVLTGRVTDRNGPWVSEQLLAMGAQVAHITICGDRPADLTAQLSFLADQGMDLIVTTGGLGPTADDLTVDTVAAFTERGVYLDTELQAHVAQIIRRWRQLRGITDPENEASRAGTRKQATIPTGAQAIPPTGTAPGVAVPASRVADGSVVPPILVLPGPPRELQAMWATALDTGPVVEALAGRTEHRQEIVRAYGLSEADLADTLRAAETDVSGFADLEITTCLRNGEVEIVTRFPESALPIYRALAAVLAEHHARQIFSTNGDTIDDQAAQLLAGHRVVTAESCTGGMIAARLTDRAGSSAYVVGGVVSYANDAKTGVLDVPATMIAEYGAVSEPVAAAMAEGALRRLDADVAISTSGIAGPGGGTELKPVGTVCFGLAIAGRPTTTRTLRFPGDRSTVRSLATTASMHILTDALRDTAVVR
ncbi:competence/damage-inducible protein A [Gordonia sp. CPCC 206044]|uniref:competence/damage-inducible protein A n=1 Tax=Gordonia sp. CPCC 206044 TaxID=3140793 RepID=UPI003AF3F716